MKLPKLIRTLQQLRKLLRSGPIENHSSWDRIGPCPDFIKAPAVELVVGGESYVVFMTYSALKAFHKDLDEKDKAREKK